MSPASYTLRSKGILNLPGSSLESKKVAEQLLLKDADGHHCFFREPGLHNHLAHHVLSAYDLGASPGLLKKISDDEAKIQIPILLDEKDKSIVVTEENWTQYVGNTHAYGGFVKFFESYVQSHSALEAVERFIFAPDANVKGVTMLIRLVSGALHPIIHVGYGLEFGDDTLVATGIAQTAVHLALPDVFYPLDNPPPPEPNPEWQKSGNRQVSRGPSLLDLLRQMYDSPILKPVMPYDPDAVIYQRLLAAMKDGRPQELRRLCSLYYVDEKSSDEEFNAKIEECIWVSTLLMFATGREGRKPRLDFFFMHLVTSSLFLIPYFKVLRNPQHKVMLLRAYIPGIFLLTLLRGRPIIKPNLLMSYTEKPRPSASLSTIPVPDEACLGDPRVDEDYNPWPELIASCLHCPDTHVLKTMRTLIYATQHYGDTPPGGAIGAFKLGKGSPLTETHTGTSSMDGTIFVRCAGILLDYMGRVTYGQPARPDWDRSALGWDEAWDDED